MRKIINIFEKIASKPNSGFYKLSLLDYIGEGYLKKWKCPENNYQNAIYVSLGRNNREITVGDKFTVLFPYSNPKDFVNVNAEIMYVNSRPEIPTDTIPIGYHGIALIDFKEVKPNLLNRLIEYNIPSIKTGPEHEELVLTTEDFLDRVLDLWDEE